MNRVLKFLLSAVAFVFLAIAAVWVLAPREGVDREIAFDASVLPDDLDSWLATRELQFSDLRPAAAKRIVWAGQAGAKTPLAVVYIHGFSASSEEIRPVPDRVADALGANLYFTRLAGHGRSGAAMAEASADDWIEDMAEAMAIGRRLGDRVLVMSTSTGATLAAIAAADPALSQDMAGVVLVSPNFRVNAAAGLLLDMPLVRHWGPLVAGERRIVTPRNAGQAAHWTLDYSTQALFTMAALMREARRQDYSKATAPVLFVYSAEDRVIDPAAIPAVRDAWGGPVTEEVRKMGPEDDPYAHVIAGDVMSPGQTGPLVEAVLAWAKGL
jgi:alpha-beta hydrolase superfamily lysophospholipase